MVGAARALATLAVACTTALPSGAAPGEASMLVRVACRDGAPNGAYELRSQDGRLRAVGAFAQGHKTGTFIFWTAGGARSAVIPYERDARTGTVALWYTAGGRETAKRLEAPFRDDVVNGALRSFHPNGAQRVEARYEQGALTAVSAWDARGKPLAEGVARQMATRDLEANGRLLAGFEGQIQHNLPHCE
jgi:antitoxin component YwqK of YwqJK toxin-antitoxin module